MLVTQVYHTEEDAAHQEFYPEVSIKATNMDENIIEITLEGLGKTKDSKDGP